ncbi:MAG: DUF6768 family protein [Planctomycetota bacterium]|jgi:hypothetical protein
MNDASQDLSLFGEVGASFRGPHGGLVLLVWIFAFAFAGLFVWAAASFLAAESTAWQIHYATISLWAGIVIAMLKIWYWGHLDRQAVLRAIRRLREPS